MNQGKTVSSLDESVQYSGSSSVRTSEGTFIGKIEERLRARAGNPRLEDTPITGKTYAGNTDKVYGESISKSEIDEILSRFKS
jgi:hypothetical protein